MELVRKIDDFLQSVDRREFYKYLAILLGIITCLLALLGWYCYSSTRDYVTQIEEINDKRAGEIKQLFESHERIIMGKKQVDALLEQNPNFKIRGFFDEVINTLQIAEKRVTESASNVERENYRESILTVTLAGMNMQELCELLQAIERAKRIFTKELDIQKSKKIPDAIDVTLIIATLQPKTAS